MGNANLKKLLVNAYYFPPIGGGGVQRTVKFAKYLPEFGWDPTILTVKDIAYRSYDPTPLDEIPEVRVVRTGSFDPFRLGYLASKGIGRSNRKRDEIEVLRSFGELEAREEKRKSGTKSGYGCFAAASKYFFVPDVQVAWAPFALYKALRVCRRDNIKAVYTTSPPESAHFVGSVIKRLTGLPWVADFRDVWGNLFWRKQLPSLHRTVNAKLERWVLGYADGLVFNTEPTFKRMRSIIGPVKPAVNIPNGFDPPDFDEDPVERSRNEFIIVHFGNFGTGLTAVDILRAFAAAGEKSDAFKEAARLYLIGVNTDDDVMEAKNLGIGGKVVFAGYLSHREGLRFCKAADLLLLIMGPAFEPERVPGKLYEYMGAGRPVLAAVPEGEAARFVRAVYGEESVTGPDDVSGVARRFVRAFENWRKGEAAVAPEPALISRFYRRRLTSQLGVLLDGLVKKTPGV
ncbi:MAG: glycosyltransferase [Candidatus Coatesbacteria bacterium]|nr:MAG: glycosyltransferase [Candidatus Coatesbacteria bacterium]